MKVTLISLDQMIISYGLRCLSSCLQSKGHRVEIIFLRSQIGRFFSPQIKNQILNLCQKSDLIGLSIMSNQFLQAQDLTLFLKNHLPIPIVWGGIHPTFCPKNCLEFADIVAVGESEISFATLLEKMQKHQSYFQTPGFWFKNNAQIIKNPPAKLAENLDSLPFFDMGPDNHYLRVGNRLCQMTKDLFKKYLPKRELKRGIFAPEYYISTSRGCPFRCSYCSSDSLKQIHAGQKYFRARSIKKVILEIKRLIINYPFIACIYFSDDDLFASEIERIREFARLWKKEIKLPFYCTTSPFSYSEDKLKILLETGLLTINMGIQTVSKNGAQVFHRLFDKKKLTTIINSIYRLSPNKTPEFDFILDNPYENQKDKLENIQFILQNLPPPRKLKLFSLVPFPGTGIYQKMQNDGLIKNENQQIYFKDYGRPKLNYLNIIFYLSSTNCPQKITRLLLQKPFLITFNNLISRKILSLIPYNLVLYLARNFLLKDFLKANKELKED